MENLVNFKNKSIIFLSGLTDIEKSGNQSFKNTLQGYLNENWKVKVFTLLPNDFENLADINILKGMKSKNYKRLPTVLTKTFRFFASFKNSFGLENESKNSQDHLNIPDANQRYNIWGRAIYFFLPFISLLIELPRITISILKDRPSIIYGVNSQGAFSASIIGRIFRIKIITRFHGTNVHPLHLKKFITKLKVAHEYIPMKMYADLQIMTDDGTRGDLVLSLIKNKVKKQLFLMNGIDDNYYKELKKTLKISQEFETAQTKEFNFLTLSRLDKWKRIDIAIKAFHKFIIKYKTQKERIKLLIVGSGPCEDELKDLAEKLEIKEFIHFYGSIDNKKVAKIISKSNCLLSFYEHSNRGNPLYEAMVAGLNIITVDDGSVEDLIEHEISGYLCSKNNLIDDCFYYMERIYSDPLIAIKMKKEIQKKVSNKLISWTERMQKELSEVEKLLKI